MIAVYYIHQHSKKFVLNEIAPFTNGSTTIRHLNFLSSWGKESKLFQNFDKTAHYLSPLNTKINKAIILKRAIPLGFSKSLCIVLWNILHSMGHNGVIYMQADNHILNEKSRWCTIEELSQHLGFLEILEIEDRLGWLAIRKSKSKNAPQGIENSSYFKLVDYINCFTEQAIISSKAQKSKFKTRLASQEQDFFYSMHWALQTMAVFDRISPLQPKVLRGIDLGGGFGFQCVELACRGHEFENFELDSIDGSLKAEIVGHWIAKKCGVESKVRLSLGRMENWKPKEKEFDFVLCLGSLLLIKREDLTNLFNNIEKSLKPGGIFLIRENFLQGDGPNEFNQFTSEELLNHLKIWNGTIEFFNHYAQPMARNDYLNSAMSYLVLKKGSLRTPFKWLKNLGKIS